MNIIKIRDEYVKFEAYWKTDNKKKDDENNNLKSPKECKTQWEGQESFIKKLAEVQNTFKTITIYEKYGPKYCLIDGIVDINTKTYKLHNVYWSDSLFHYVNMHNVKPTQEFIDFIVNYESSEGFTSFNVEFDLSINHLSILDSLVKYGFKENVLKNKEEHKIMKHTGLLRYGKKGIEYITINTIFNDSFNRSEQIYEQFERILDQDRNHALFCTIPYIDPYKIVKKDSYLNYPKIKDLYIFIFFYEEYRMYDYFIFATEGYYIIQTKNSEKFVLNINNTKKKKMLSIYKSSKYNLIKKHQKKIKKIKKKEIEEYYFSKIARDTEFIENINKFIKDLNIEIKYFPRVKVNNKWVYNPISAEALYFDRVK
jgi:hypothetical protein